MSHEGQNLSGHPINCAIAHRHKQDAAVGIFHAVADPLCLITVKLLDLSDAGPRHVQARNITEL